MSASFLYNKITIFLLSLIGNLWQIPPHQTFTNFRIQLMALLEPIAIMMVTKWQFSDYCFFSICWFPIGKKRISFFHIYLFNHLLIYISMDSWILIWLNELQSIAIIILQGSTCLRVTGGVVAPASQCLCSSNLFSSCCGHFLSFWQNKMLQVHQDLPYPTSRISHFFKEPRFILVEKGTYNQDLVWDVLTTAEGSLGIISDPNQEIRINVHTISICTSNSARWAHAHIFGYKPNLQGLFSAFLFACLISFLCQGKLVPIVLNVFPSGTQKFVSDLLPYVTMKEDCTCQSLVFVVLFVTL